MSDYKFWSVWTKYFRNFYFLLLFLFLAVVILYMIAYSLGISNIIGWETNTSLQNLKHSFRSFDVGLFNVNVPAYSYIIEENFVPKDFTVNISYASVFIILIFFCLAVANSIVTTFNRTYFLGGIAGLIFTFLLLKFDELGLFGIYENYFMGAFILVLGVVSYYFHAFRPDYSFFKKLFVFCLIYGAILGVCAFFSSVKYPLLSLSNHGILLTAILSIFFIILVSHEILYGFLFLVTYSAGQQGKKTLIHFIVVSLLYFLCLLLLYLKVMGFSDFEIFGTNAFLIIPFSALIGIYGFRARRANFENIVSFNPYGALLYIILAIVCFATLGYFFATFNDPAIEAFQDYIIFTHIGIGFIFFIYILANFASLLNDNLPVYKVVYKPERIPFYVVRLGGLIFAVILMLRSNYLQLNQSVAAYMIGLGDINLAEGEAEIAKKYYQISKDYDYYNFRSNYSLAELLLDENKEDDAIYALKETFDRNPSPQSFVKLSDIYLKNDLYFDAIYALKEGVKAFPENANLYNNLSLLYYKTAFVDSAYIFINSARRYSKNNERILANYWGFLAKNSSLFENQADSILASEEKSEYSAVVNNRLAFLNALNKKSDTNSSIIEKDTAFAEEDFAILNNYILNASPSADSSLYKNIVEKEKKYRESTFTENLTLLKALYLYSNNNIKEGFQTADKLAKEGLTNVGYYNYLLGLWSLQNGAPRLAVDYFNAALEKGNKESFFYKALALAENGNIAEAIQAWDNVIQINDPSTNAMAAAIKGILSEKDFTAFFQLSDEFKYHSLRFRFYELSDNQREALIQNIEDQKIRVAARLLEGKKAIDQENFDLARSILANLENEQIQDSASVREVKRFKERLSVKSFSTAAMTNAAIIASPFDYSVIKNAVTFYNNQKNTEAAYNIVLDATKLNPYSVDLLQLYILQSLKVNLISYANDGLEKLKEIANAEEYTAFEKTFLAEKEKQQSSDEAWQ